MVEIRKATYQDISSIAELLLEEFSKPPFLERSSLKHVIGSVDYYLDIGGAFIAISEGCVIGVLIYKIEQWWQGPVVIIEDMAVMESHKNKGIGISLLEELESHAFSQNAVEVVLSTHRRSSAIKFYEKFGFVVDDNTVCLSKSLR